MTQIAAERIVRGSSRRYEERPADVVVEQPYYERYVAPEPVPRWYENLPTWVAISIFLHGLILLLAIVLLASPGTFGLASEGDVQRAADAAAANDRRITSLEAQVTALRGTAPAAAAPSATTPAPVDPALSQRLSTLEGRVTQLCAASTPPC